MKITYEEYAYIMGYKKKHIFQKYLCNFYIEKSKVNTSYIISSEIKHIVYIVFCVPINIVSIICCIYDAIKQTTNWVCKEDDFCCHSTEWPLQTKYPSRANRMLDVINAHVWKRKYIK